MTFCVINFFVFALGATILGVGIATFFLDQNVLQLAQLGTTGTLLRSYGLGFLRSAAIVFMTTGVIILFLGFLGCYGVLVKSKMMVGTVGAVLFVLIMAQITAGGLAFYYRDLVQARLKTGLVVAIKDNYEGTPNASNPISKLIDFMHTKLQCCGVVSVRDFVDTKWFRHRTPKNLTVPASCCLVNENQELVDQSCPFFKPGPSNPHTGTPCLRILQAIVKKNIYVIFGLVVALIGVQVSAMCITFAIARKI